MNNLHELIDLLKEDKQIQRFKELEKVIDHNESIKEDFERLLHFQKIMVKHEFEKSSQLKNATSNYNSQLQLVLNYPIIEEYLDLLELINNDISFLKSIIEQEIAIDFD